MPASIVPASNKILVAGTPIIAEMEVGANATAAKMLPGSWVVYDAADNAVKEAGAKADDVIGIIDTDPTHKIGDNYAVGDPIPIIVGPNGILVMAKIAANEDLTQGDWLVTAANGETAELAVGAMGGQGCRVGQAWDTWTAAAAALVLIQFNKSPEPAAAA